MATDVVMPQMGESIAEGTIVRWIKKVGDSVERDEPLFEISTDKVDAEIPSPAAGVLTEIRAKEGETVPVNTVVAVIGSASSRPAAASPPRAPAVPPPQPQADGSPKVAAPAPAEESQPPGHEGDAVRQRSSPLVRNLAKEHNVDISKIRGTGISGRVTRDDILAFIGIKGQTGQAGQARQDQP